MEAPTLLTSTQLLRCVAWTQASRCLLPVPLVFCLNQLIECERLLGPDMKDNHMAGAALRRSIARSSLHTCKLDGALSSFILTDLKLLSLMQYLCVLLKRICIYLAFID